MSTGICFSLKGNQKNDDMNKTAKYKNLDELRARQAALNAEESILGKEIIAESKVALITLPVVSLLKPADPLRIIKVDGKINVPGKVFSYLLPIVVNQTLFRKSGFMVRIITAMIARRIGKRIGPKVAMWLIRMAERHLRNRKPKGHLLPGHVLQQNRQLQSKHF